MDDEEDATSPLDEMLDDKLRVSYYKGYLAAVHQAIKYAIPHLFSLDYLANICNFIRRANSYISDMLSPV